MRISKILILLLLLITANEANAQDRSEVGFTGRYLFSNSAITLDESHSLLTWNLFGPQYDRGLTDNFQVGVTSSWLLSPIVLGAKITHSVSDKINLGLTGNLGIEWIDESGQPAAIITGTITLGDKLSNISGSIYGFSLIDSDSGILFNISAYHKIKLKTAFVFESYLLSSDNEFGGAFIPGVQLLTKRKRLLQLGIPNIFYDGTYLLIPIPIIQLQVPFK